MAQTISTLERENQSEQALTTLTMLRKLQDNLPKYAMEPSLGMQYGEQNKYVTWKFDPKKFKRIEVLHLTDVQFGHKQCKIDKLIEYRDWVLSSPNRYVLIGGDLVDAATILSPGSPWENICAPQGQVYKLCELLAPLRHRILGYVGGNHERRAEKTFGDLGILIATLLQVPYSGGQQLIDIHFGEHKPFKFHLWHGVGSAKTKGAKAQMIDRFMNQGDSQMYLIGHLHDLVLLGGWRTSRKGKNTIKVEKIFGGMSSSFLNYWGTYAEVAGLPASNTAMIRTILESDGTWETQIK